MQPIGKTAIVSVLLLLLERISDVPNHLTKLRVEDLIRFLWINEKTNAFIYYANLGRKNPTHIVEIYYALRPQAIEWRKQRAQFALQLDDDLIYGLDDDVAVTQLVFYPVSNFGYSLFS